MEVKVEEIKIDGNPRSDFGNMEELITSIKGKYLKYLLNFIFYNENGKI